MSKIHQLLPSSEIAIFGRILEAGKRPLTAPTARYLLTLDFPEGDKARMHDLAVRNQRGALSSEEADELQSFVKAGHLLALLQSKARRSLKKKVS
jgi:hypothetical protein